jgi:hypothetical protein
MGFVRAAPARFWQTLDSRVYLSCDCRKDVALKTNGWNGHSQLECHTAGGVLTARATDYAGNLISPSHHVHCATASGPKTLGNSRSNVQQYDVAILDLRGCCSAKIVCQRGVKQRRLLRCALCSLGFEPLRPTAGQLSNEVADLLGYLTWKRRLDSRCMTRG